MRWWGGVLLGEGGDRKGLLSLEMVVIIGKGGGKSKLIREGGGDAWGGY